MYTDSRRYYEYGGREREREALISIGHIGHTDLVRTLHFDEDKIVSASYDQSIRVWDLRYVM